MIILLLTAALVVGGLVTVSARDLPSEDEVANATYMGSRACRACHMTAAQGEMYKIWENSKHAKAYATLATDEAKAIAAGLSIANPQEDATCLKCHSTTGDVPSSRVHARFDVSEGVGCESCHGAGEHYRTKQVMCGISRVVSKARASGPSSERRCMAQRATLARFPKVTRHKDFDYESQSKRSRTAPRGTAEVGLQLTSGRSRIEGLRRLEMSRCFVAPGRASALPGYLGSLAGLLVHGSGDDEEDWLYGRYENVSSSIHFDSIGSPAHLRLVRGYSARERSVYVAGLPRLPRRRRHHGGHGALPRSA